MNSTEKWCWKQLKRFVFCENLIHPHLIEFINAYIWVEILEIKYEILFNMLSFYVNYDKHHFYSIKEHKFQ